MNSPEKLHQLSYEFLHGPVPVEGLLGTPSEGNCRLAVQDYFYTQLGIYLEPEEIVPPQAFTGEGMMPLQAMSDTQIFDLLRRGDIVYAQKLRDSKGRIVKGSNISEHEKMRNLHMAVYLGILDDQIISRLPVIDVPISGEAMVWHSSYISGGTAVWPVEKFCHFYQPVIAKRIVIRK